MLDKINPYNLGSIPWPGHPQSGLISMDKTINKKKKDEDY
jgi:hypothetical protein